MKHLLDRMIVSLRERREDMAEAVYMFFYEIHEEIGRDEIEPRCRAIGKLLMFDGPIRGGGIESYVSMYGWRTETADDILAGYKLIGSPKRAAVFERVAAHMAGTSVHERRGMASRQGFTDTGFGEPNEQLNEQVAQLYLLDDEEGQTVDLAMRYLRRRGLIRIVSSADAVERAREGILARSETQRRLKAHRAEQYARLQESSRRRTEALAQLGRLANVHIRCDRSWVVQAADDPPKNRYCYHILAPYDESAPRQRTAIITGEDGRPYVIDGEVAYYEDGDRGVLASHPSGEVLAETPIEPGATDFVADWRLP